MSQPSQTTNIDYRDSYRDPLQRYHRIILCDRTRALREKLLCTQEELAESLGVNASYVGLLERSGMKCDLSHAESFLRKAYAQFGLPFDDLPKAVPPHFAPSAPFHAAVARATARTAPADVDPQVVASAPLRQVGRMSRLDLAQELQAFKTEFGLSGADMASLLGVSGGHEYVMRTGRQGAGLEGLRAAVRKVRKEAERRRLEARGAPVAAVAPAPPPPVLTAPVAVAPVVAAPPAATATTRTDVVMRAALVTSDAALLKSLDFDFTTKHRFQKLPDGSILIAKEP